MRAKSESDKYLINARWSLGSKRKKLFFVVLVGKDRRLDKILDVSDQRHNTSLAKAIIYSGLLAWVLIGVLVVTFVAIYLAKSYAGIDLVAGSSPFPEFLKRIGICH